MADPRFNYFEFHKSNGATSIGFEVAADDVLPDATMRIISIERDGKELLSPWFLTLPFNGQHPFPPQTIVGKVAFSVYEREASGAVSLWGIERHPTVFHRCSGMPLAEYDGHGMLTPLDAGEYILSMLLVSGERAWRAPHLTVVVPDDDAGV